MEVLSPWSPLRAAGLELGDHPARRVGNTLHVVRRGPGSAVPVAAAARGRAEAW